MASENANGFVGHTTAVIVPSVAANSAFVAYDAVGSAFSAALAAGRAGGYLHRIMMYDKGTANAWLRFHLFSTGFSASVNGTMWTLASTDFPNYLGYADVLPSNWVTAGATANMAVVDLQPPMPLYSLAGNRMVWGQLQTPSTPTAGNVADSLSFTFGVMYD